MSAEPLPQRTGGRRTGAIFVTAESLAFSTFASVVSLRRGGAYISSERFGVGAVEHHPDIYVFTILTGAAGWISLYLCALKSDHHTRRRPCPGGVFGATRRQSKRRVSHGRALGAGHARGRWPPGDALPAARGAKLSRVASAVFLLSSFYVLVSQF
jgi:hypothetical protein